MTLVGLPAVVDFTVRACAIAALVALVLQVSRVRASAARHAAWLSVVAAMLTLPLLRMLVPPVLVPMSPSMTSWMPGAEDLAIPLVSATNSSTTMRSEPATPDSEGIGLRATTGRAPANGQSRSPWMWSAWTAYIATTGLLLGRLIAGWVAARRLIRCSRRLVLAADVAESSEITAPVTIGLMRPRVLLPTSARTWSQEALTAALAHERAHIRRRDLLWLVVARLNRALFWFHPLAWWLERQLVITAEHAADDLAARELGSRARYAAVLVDIARWAATPRFAPWQAVGMNGSHRLSDRIDRLLHADADRCLPTSRRAVVAVGCAMAIALAVACQRQASVAPLVPNPAITEQMETSARRMAETREAWSMTAEQASSLQASWEKNPEDLAAARKLLLHYQPIHEGIPVPDRAAFIAPRRAIVLYMIEHHPDSSLVRMGWFVDSPLPDPQGQAQAEALWRRVVARSDVTPRALGNAASYFRNTDVPEAVRLLIRARAAEPTGGEWYEADVIYNPSWTRTLASLYASVLTGASLPGRRSASAAFTNDVRAGLDASTDATLLAATAEALFSQRLRMVDQQAAADEVESLARRYAARATSLDPGVAQTMRGPSHLAASKERARISELSRARAPGLVWGDITKEYEAVSGVAEPDRAVALVTLAETAYMRGEYEEYSVDHPPVVRSSTATARAYVYTKEKAREYWDVSARAAEDALQLASGSPRSNEYGFIVTRAHLALGIAALRHGDKASALDHLRAAADAPSSESLLDVDAFSLEYRLTDSLLDSGERETVAEYYEKMAVKPVTSKQTALETAAAIRAGRMPEGYQRRHMRP